MLYDRPENVVAWLIASVVVLILCPGWILAIGAIVRGGVWRRVDGVSRRATADSMRMRAMVSTIVCG